MDATVVIPTYERVEVLVETLNRLTEVDYPTVRWEAVVVDDGSSLGALEKITNWIETSRAPVRLLRQAHRGPAAARNYGARAAAGEALIFLDNDCVVARDFIRRHLEVLNEHPGCWVVGRVVHPPEIRGTPFGRYRDDLLEAFHSSQNQVGVSETEAITTQNLALWRVDFIRLGGFDEGFSIASSEDWELGRRARDHDIRVLYDPHNMVVHNDWAVNLDRFCDRQRLYSISDVLLWRKYGKLSPRAQLVRENAPIQWRDDFPRLAMKKMVKRLLATRAGLRTLRRACRTVEQLVPDSRVSRGVYQLTVGTAIFQGVREGLARYGEAAAAPEVNVVKQEDPKDACGNHP